MLNAYIWDLDGTLLDSYGVIVSSLVSAAGEFGRCVDADQVLKTVKQDSVTAFIRQFAEETGTDFDSFMACYRGFCARRNDRITLMPGALETLETLRARGARHFVYTHRGASAGGILARLGLLPFFGEIVTHQNGFPPKPAPDGLLHLMEAHRLNPEETCYVGDRALDVLCAFHAGVSGILLLEEGSCVRPTGRESRIIRRLTELTAQP